MRRKKARNINDTVYVIFITSLIIFFFIILNSSFCQNKNPITTKYVSVKNGDTLWHIVTRHGSDNVDIRQQIYEIEKLNHLEGFLQPGQRLEIPVYEEEQGK